VEVGQVDRNGADGKQDMVHVTLDQPVSPDFSGCDHQINVSIFSSRGREAGLVAI